MSTSNSRNVIILASIAIFSLMLAACGGAKKAPVTVPAGAQPGDLVGLEPCTYRAGDVEYAAACGTLVVPENRADPDSRLIVLPVIRVRATGDNPAEPILYLAGGPGASNLHFRYLGDVIKRHDFVQVGYRGIDGSVVLDCPEISQVVRSARHQLSDEALESYTGAGASCAGRLQAEGVDLAGYTLTETIDDNEDARVALGYERISLFGASEGYARLCAQDPECSARTDDLAALVRRLSEELPDRWLFIPIDEDAVKLITSVMFFESIQPPGMPGPRLTDARIQRGEVARGP